MRTPNPAITIRCYQNRDLPRLLKLEQEAFDFDTWPEELFHYYSATYPDLCLVAKVNGRIAGYCIGRIRTRTAAEIDSVAVFRRFQRKGVARRLVRSLLRRFRARHITNVGLMVRPDNTSALAFYRGL